MSEVMNNVVENAINSNYEKSGTYNQNGESISFSFNTILRASEKVYFVNSVSELLIGENYNSVLRDLLTGFFIIDVFTDVDTSWIYADVDDEDYSIDYITEMEDLVYGTNIVEIVLANIDDLLFQELTNAIDLNIEYRTGIHKNPITESLANLINTLNRKIGDFSDMESMAEMMAMFSGIADEFTMDNMIEAYGKSNMYKNHQKKLEDSAAKREGVIESNATPILSPAFEV